MTPRPEVRGYKRAKPRTSGRGDRRSCLRADLRRFEEVYRDIELFAGRLDISDDFLVQGDALDVAFGRDLFFFLARRHDAVVAGSGRRRLHLLEPPVHALLELVDVGERIDAVGRDEVVAGAASAEPGR